MIEERRLTRDWIVYGVILGVLADIMYVAAAFAPLPDAVGRVLGFGFGPLLTLSFFGIYHFFRLHRKTLLLQAATLCGVVAGTVVNLMVVVQQAIHMTVPPDARADLGLAYDGLNVVQLALDVSWDIYLSAATVLLGLVMLGHPRFGAVWGTAAILIGAGLLTLNLAAFPLPPGDVGSVDLGPIVGAFYLVVFLRIATSMRWVDERLERLEAPGLQLRA